MCICVAKEKPPHQKTSGKPANQVRENFNHSKHENFPLHLQRMIGNRAVQRLLENDSKKCHAGLTGSVSPCFEHNYSRIPAPSSNGGAVQAKLAVNKPGDEYEQEADRVAAQVMRMPEPRVQRICAECEEEDRIAAGTIRRAHATTPSPAHVRRQQAEAAASIEEAPQIVSDVASESGRPLDPLVRSFMEPRFGYNFSRVRIHTGARAAESTQAVNAVAYAVGQDLVFDEGAYRPETTAGRHLIAHELTHVIQQGAADTSVQSDEESKFDDSSTTRHAHKGLQPYAQGDRRVQRQNGCDCCISSAAIKNVSKLDNLLMGHRFDFEIKMERKTRNGAGPEGECRLEWWERTNMPAINGHPTNTWTDLAQLAPEASTFKPWNDRQMACDTNSTVTITDRPAISKEHPGQNIKRTLEFVLKAQSGPDSTCANKEKILEAKQVLALKDAANGWKEKDWENSLFSYSAESVGEAWLG